MEEIERENIVQQEKTLTVSFLNQAIAAALENALPDAVWVTGELQEYSRSAEAARTRKWGQVYFELVEKEEGKDQVKAKVKAMLWGQAHEMILAKLKEAGEKLALQDGLQVRLLCRVNYYWKWGDLRLVVEDIDPAFTLGQMERAKRELVKKLKAQGLFDRNRSTVLPSVVQGIGLITAPESAAYHDFLQELKGSGYGFKIYFWPAVMQGESTEKNVVEGLRVLGRMEEVEAILIVRGGGARSDLIWFDKEAIAVSIANANKPVLTGIGHEIDQSVADMVAHASFKTPTAAAQFLAERCRAFEREIIKLAQGILDEIKNFILHSCHDLKQSARVLLAETKRHMEVRFERLEGLGQRIQEKTLEILRTWSAQCAQYGKDLAREVRVKIEGERQVLETMAQECRLKDPERLLKRGYSLLLDHGGKLVKSVKRIQKGDELRAKLADGVIYAQALKIE